MSSKNLQAIDLNDPWALKLHRELVKFRDTTTDYVWYLQAPNHTQQRVAQTIAHMLSLEYEYTYINRTVSVIRPLDTFKGILSTTDDEYLYSQNTTTSADLAQNTSKTLDSSSADGQEPATSNRLGSSSEILSDLSPALHVPLLDNVWSTEISDWLAQESLNASENGEMWNVPPPTPPTPQRAASRIGSMSSMQSVRSVQSYQGKNQIRAAFSRRTSVHSKAGSTYEEIIFDATPSRPSSTRSESRRRGPMDSIQKATMSAVKKIGACWRCKILRKTCDPVSPCPACPKPGHQSEWCSVGCRRGGFEDEMPHTLLCPRIDNSVRTWDRESPASSSGCNVELEALIRRRNENIANYDFEGDNFKGKLNNTILSTTKWPEALRRILHSPIACARLQPQASCVVAIQWALEAHHSRWKFFVGDARLCFSDLDQFNRLICFAALYQAETESDQLVNQSLICLRSCFDAFYAQSAGLVDGSSHTLCYAISGCKVAVNSELDLHIKAYLKELTRVFFRKENMRSNETWLSIFYSLYLQGIIRRIMCSMCLDRTGPFPGQYLHIAVRLFAARFATYDPLQPTYTVPCDTEGIEEDYLIAHLEAARSAVDSASWDKHRIGSSSEFLKLLFEDSGAPINSSGSTLSLETLFQERDRG